MHLTDKTTTEIIDYVNEEYPLDLSDIVVAHQDYAGRPSVVLVQIHTDKLVCQIGQLNVSVPFVTPISSIDEFYPAYLKLVRIAKLKLGKKTAESVERTFCVVESRPLGGCFWRLTVMLSGGELPDQAGFAYLFTTNHQQKTARYYTLRKVWRVVDNSYAWIDVFWHDQTALWASKLQAGDHIISKREFPEYLTHLTLGQALLIVDETALPTVAGLLERWTNLLNPIIIVLWQGDCDANGELEMYFDTVPLWQACQRHFVAIDHQNQEQSISQVVQIVSEYQGKIAIEKVWGVGETQFIKTLRKQLNPMLGLPASDCVLKVYWRYA